MICSRNGRFAAVASLGLLAIAPISLADEPAGVLWETTSQPVMEGMPMPMPMTKMKLCAPKVWTRPPEGGDKNCKNSNFHTVGNKATWTIACTGEMPMTGVGEMTFGADGSYVGVVKFSSDMMSMTVNLTGKKIGTCDKPIA
jgi:hypothetical protein